MQSFNIDIRVKMNTKRIQSLLQSRFWLNRVKIRLHLFQLLHLILQRLHLSLQRLYSIQMLLLPSLELPNSILILMKFINMISITLTRYYWCIWIFTSSLRPHYISLLTISLWSHVFSLPLFTFNLRALQGSWVPSLNFLNVKFRFLNHFSHDRVPWQPQVLSVHY